MQRRSVFERFNDDGYYLVDASDIPILRSSSVAQKKRILSDSLPALTKELRKLVLNETRIVLISSRVFQVCFQPLREAGLNVINEGSIDFPANGRQKQSARKLGQLLDDRLRDAMKALEESERFWRPGFGDQGAAITSPEPAGIAEGAYL